MGEQAARLRPERLVWAPPLVSAGVLVLTAITVAIVAHDTTAKARERFARAVQLTRTAIEYRMGTHVATLRGVAGLFVASEQVTRREFRLYVQQLDLPQRLPGALGIGWSQRLEPGAREAFTRAARAEGLAGFRVWPEGERSEYHTIRYLEPFDSPNRAAIGYDMHTEATHAAAMDRARDRARASATARVTLVQDAAGGQAQPGFLVYLPVYAGGDVPATVPERRARLAGFVYSAFRADDLFRAVLASQDAPPLDLEVYDGNGPPAPEHLLHRTPRDDPPSGHPPRFATTTRVRVAGRIWKLAVASQPAFDASVASSAPALLLATGLGAALLLFGFLRVQIEARLRAEEATLELQRSEEALREAGRAKDDFLASLSHELRTPLGNVLMWAQLLRTRAGEPESAARAVETIERNARMLGRLIDDLLDVSRIVSGKLSLSMRPTELGAVVRAAIEAAQPGADAKRLAIAFDDGGAPRWVSGDPARLQQVVGNLLSNAIKFTSEGGRVGVRLDAPRGRARLTVTDTGTGIAPGMLPHVFERFRQADSRSTRAHGGLGLGLAIVRHLVERHGGSVTAESEGMGRGATFTVQLPLLGREASVPAVAVVAAAATPAARSLGGIRALVVDDEPDAREAVATVLARAGANVTAVGSAAEALAALERAVPDVLLSDIAMPDEDGYALIRRVRTLPLARGGCVPAVAVTAYATLEDRRRALQAGFQAHLPKPLDAARLIATVVELLEQPVADEPIDAQRSARSAGDPR